MSLTPELRGILTYEGQSRVKRQKGSSNQIAGEKKVLKNPLLEDRNISEGTYDLEYDPDLGFMANQNVTEDAR